MYFYKTEILTYLGQGLNMLEFHIHTTAQYADELASQLTLLGAAAITWQDAADEPIYELLPGEFVLWDNVMLTALFEDKQAIHSISHYLNEQQAQQVLSQFIAKEVPQQDWVRASLDQFVPLQFGKKLWICPSWHQPPDPHAVNVMMDPGLAFGTGTHPTTALCLEWLEAHINGNEVVLDYGCGSGILAIASLKLGAARVIAIDHDQQALEACQLNRERNQLPLSQLVTALPETLDIKNKNNINILLANILAKPLITLAPHFAGLVKPGGQLVLSGILLSQLEEVKLAYQPWFAMDAMVVREEWVLLAGCRI